MILELCLPICAIFFSTLLFIVYFFKKKINLFENKMYAIMLGCVLMDSILVTIDDGARAEGFIPLLEEYQVNATLFLISGWYPKEKFKSEYMELASHTHNLHTPRVCPGGQGSPLKCLEKTKLVTDLQISRELLDGTEAFCFPFYEYNDYGISALQEAGFKMGFIGGGRKATPGVNLYKIPRLPLNRYTTLQQYISKIS